MPLFCLTHNIVLCVSAISICLCAVECYKNVNPCKTKKLQYVEFVFVYVEFGCVELCVCVCVWACM